MGHTQRYRKISREKIEMLKSIFGLSDEEILEWLEEEGEEGILKVLKAFEGDEDPEDEKPDKMGPEASRILELFRGFSPHVEKGYRAEYARALAALGRFLMVKRKAMGYDARSGMVESPEIAYIKAKMASNW